VASLETVIFSIGILAIIAGLMTRHYMIGGIVSVAAFLGYFSLSETGSWLSLFMFAVGTILVIAEIFLPTYGILGVLGILFGAGGMVGQNGSFAASLIDIVIGALVGIVTFYVLVKLGYRMPFNEKIVLHSALNKERGFQSQTMNMQVYMGQSAVTITPLRPTGKATFPDGQILEVVSDNEIISAEESVTVVAIRNNQLFVRRSKHGH
jgi:membrane-bound serine protease (ClpP class)